MAKQSRLNLSEKLHSLCPNVYFQPPNGTKLKYPCIIYDLDSIDKRNADNAAYTLNDRYSIQYITRDPDDDVKYKIIQMRYCSAGKFFISENLYHYNFSIYI